MAVVFANVYFSNSLEMTANRRTTVSLETTLLEGQTDKSTVPLPINHGCIYIGSARKSEQFHLELIRHFLFQ